MAIKTTLIWHLLLLVLAFSSTFSSSALLSSYLDNNDLVRIKSVIELPITDLKSITLANIYYSLNGQKLLSPNGVIKNEDKICQHLIASIDDQLENIYFGVSAAKLLNKCQVRNQILIKSNHLFLLNFNFNYQSNWRLQIPLKDFYEFLSKKILI